jgi:hypothetical protein
MTYKAAEHIIGAIADMLEEYADTRCFCTTPEAQEFVAKHNKLMHELTALTWTIKSLSEQYDGVKHGEHPEEAE